MTAHTPGPWITAEVAGRPDSIRLDIVSCGTVFKPSFVAGDILPEDARLIAAAPELLAALRKCVARLKRFGIEDGYNNDESFHFLTIDAEDAIAKAEGRAAK